jgi:hypothetical protein
MLRAILGWTEREVKGLRRSQRTTLAVLVTGLVHGGRAGVAAIGRSLPGAAFVKHKIKRVDRFLGNERVDLAAVSVALLAWATRRGGRLVLALDWTDLPGGKKLLSLAVPTRGRAVPVHGRVVDQAVMYKSQNSLEEGLLRELRVLVPAGTSVVIVADRGFGRTQLMKELRRLGFSFVLRVSGSALFEREGLRQRVQQVPLGRGQTHWFREVRYRDRHPVAVNLVLTWRRRMKEAWFLATDLTLPPREVIALYGYRMQIEEAFRDAKSVRWGFRLRHVCLRDCGRWERLLMVLGVAYLFLLAVGAEAESRREHRRLQANTVRKRTLSWLTVGRARFRDHAHHLARCVRSLQSYTVEA